MLLKLCGSGKDALTAGQYDRPFAERRNYLNIRIFNMCSGRHGSAVRFHASQLISSQDSCCLYLIRPEDLVLATPDEFSSFYSIGEFYNAA